jgi:hypothetical protein
MRPGTNLFAIVGTALLTSTLALCSNPPPAWADNTVSVEAEVVVQRGPPFDAWCVKPDCPGASTFSALLKLPPLLVPSFDQGLIEQRLRHAVAGALQDTATLAVGHGTLPAPVVDLAQTAAAAVLGDTTTLERLGGLGASVLRAALAYEIDSIVPGDPGCTGVARIDALYEGLAVAASLSPLRFPLKRGHVPAGCVEIAKRAAYAIDAEVVGALVSGEMRRGLEAALATIDGVEKSCGGLAGAPDRLIARLKATDATLHASSADIMAQSLRRLRAQPTMAPAPAPPSLGADAPAPNASAVDASAIDASPVEQACSQALVVLEAIDPASLEAVAERGLGSVSLASLTQTFHLPALPCDSAARCGRSERVLALLLRFAIGQASEGDLQAVVEADGCRTLERQRESGPEPVRDTAVVAGAPGCGRRAPPGRRHARRNGDPRSRRGRRIPVEQIRRQRRGPAQSANAHRSHAVAFRAQWRCAQYRLCARQVRR